MARLLAVNWQDLKHPASGGAEVHLEEILRRLVSRGHEADILCCGFPGAKKSEVVKGIKIIRHGSRSLFNYTMPFVFKKLIKQEKYDIILEDINKIPFFGPLYHKLPTLIIFHHLFAGSIFKEINPFLGLYIYFSEKPIGLVYRKNHIMAVSESTAGELIGKGIPQSRVHVVHNGINHDIYSPGPEGAKFSQPTLLYVGRIKKYKSIETAIDAMPLILRQLPGARMVIIGKGDQLPSLEAKAKSMHLEQAIEFKGFVPKEVKVEYYRRSTLLFYPSFKEGWGLTNIEANACGTPVLAARVPGLRDSVDEGRSGLLFEYGNVNEFVEKAIKILADAEFRSALERGAVAHAARFSWDKAADETERLMELVLAERK